MRTGPQLVCHRTESGRLLRYSEIHLIGPIMNEPGEASQLQVTRRFLIRFADLMSNGSNSANLLLAAELLEEVAARAKRAEERLEAELARSANLETALAALSTSDHVLLPTSILRLAKSQFESLSGEFGKTGNVVAQAMCEASASTLENFIESADDRRSIAATRFSPRA